jgi:hypothetical protein
VYNERSHDDRGSRTISSYSGDERLIYGQRSFFCWSAFKTGRARIPETTRLLLQDSLEVLGNPTTGITFTKLTVDYPSDSCSGLANTTNDAKGLEFDYLSKSDSTTVISFQEGNCSATDIECVLDSPVPAKCRLNVRMNAAFVLTVALIVKAIYMITINIVARGHTKRSLLTFGDVIVASASNPELRIQGYVPLTLPC